MKKEVSKFITMKILLEFLLVIPLFVVSFGKAEAIANPCLSAALVTPPGCEPPPPPPPSSVFDNSEEPIIFIPITIGDIAVVIPKASEYLPPEPDSEEGTADVEGVDTDADGVRDDVERHIAHKYPNQPLIRTTLYEYAKQTQYMLNNARTQDAESLRADYEQMRKTRRCIQIIRRMEGDAEYVAMDVRAVTVNTLERFRRQQEIDKKLSGVYELIPSSSTDCD